MLFFPLASGTGVRFLTLHLTVTLRLGSWALTYGTCLRTVTRIFPRALELREDSWSYLQPRSISRGWNFTRSVKRESEQVSVGGCFIYTLRFNTFGRTFIISRRVEHKLLDSYL